MLVESVSSCGVCCVPFLILPFLDGFDSKDFILGMFSMLIFCLVSFYFLYLEA